MELTNLPPEVQFKYLLQLTPQEILNFCQVNKQAASICNNAYFWNQKAEQDFGYSMQLLCQMHPYWQYHFAGSLLDEASIIPPLIRAGKLDQVEDLLTDPSLTVGRVIYIAVLTSDLTTLEYFKEYIQGLEEIYYSEDPFYHWLVTALFSGNINAFNYLMTLKSDYLDDAIILNDLRKELEANQRAIGLQFLRPYIERFVASNPQVNATRRGAMMQLRNYLQQ